jgi:hypothetical protein
MKAYRWIGRKMVEQSTSFVRMQIQDMLNKIMDFWVAYKAQVS